MARIICALSSIEFSCEHFPIYLHSSETFHPIFNVSQRKLLSFLGKWAAGELTKTDSYLLFIALLNSSSLIDFRTAISRNEQTDSIIAQNMEFLSKTVHKINTVYNPNIQFPRFAITKETRYLTNVHYWLEVWHERYEEFVSGNRKAIEDRKLVKREAALERLIKNPYKPISSYASQLADWASVAGEFPEVKMLSPFSKVPIYITLSEYWKTIITKCASDSTVYQIPEKHIKELLEHCEDTIPAVGSIFSNALFSILRGAIKKKKDFLDIEDFIPSYKFLEDMEEKNTEMKNIKQIVDTSPVEKPEEKNYPTKFAYLKAKMQWEMSKKFSK